MSDLVHNERVKLLANALDRMSTGFVVVGVLGKALDLTPGNQLWVSLLSPAGWILAALVLHFMARRVLGRLRP